MSTDRVLVVFHTAEGQTSKIASRVASRLHELGVVADLNPVSVAPGPGGYAGVVVADPVHYTRQSRRVRRYVREHVDELSAIPSAFVQVSLAVQGAADPAVAADLRKIAATVTVDRGWHADVLLQVAGTLAYSKYGWFKRRLMRRIAKGNGGDTDMSRDHEYTDWAAVDAFTDAFATRVRAGRADGG